MFELLGTKLMTFDFPIYLLGCYFVWLLDFEVSRMVTDACVWLLLTGTPQKFGYQNNSEELMCFNNLLGKLQHTHL